ncbi:MAG: ferritin-like domain-containing protein [Dolichospermum sp.]
MVQLTQRPITNKITNLQQKFIYEINTMFDAENRFLESQQMMWQCSQNNKFKMIIETHIQETEQHIKNLEQVLNILGEKPQRITCDLASGLISQCQKFTLLAADNPKIVDLGLAEWSDKIEQMEIFGYRHLIKVAEEMTENQVVELLEQNLYQDEQVAQKLEQLIMQLLPEVKTPQVKSNAKAR